MDPHRYCVLLTLKNRKFQVWLEAEGEEDEVAWRKGENVSAAHIVYPYILPKIYASVFMLYALHYKKDDDDYWAR